MKSVHTRLAMTVLGLALATPLIGCSAFQSDSDFFGSDPSVQTLTKDNLEKAHTLRLQKKYKEAVKILSQLVLANPEDGAVLGEYGKTLVEQGRSGEALEFLKRAVELSPHDATLYSALGVAWDQAGNPDNARDAYQKALQLHPNDPAILNNYALSRLMAGNVAEAENLIQLAKQAGSTPRIEQNAKLIADVAESAAKTAGEKATQTDKTKNPPPQLAGDAIRKQAKPIITDPVPQVRPEEKDPMPEPRPDTGED